MFQFPKEPRKIKERISRYERELRKEYKKFGFISDGYGKRYLLGPLYLILGDLPRAIRSFEWFEHTFPGDIGEPFHCLCWTLALYRSGNMTGASLKLRQTMLSNLYLIPHLLGLAQDKLNIWHGSNLAEKDYLQYTPPEIWALWDEPALRWAKETYESPEFCRIRARYIEIYEQLGSEPPGPKRSQLVSEAFGLATMGKDQR
ncbi:MAG: hypothetical protein AUK03_05485 [Anaerolineae bacterium CG2_30_64_16]|nr:MAG: hypothetical protein AUK03_05485 [Anaerolineae bacterium CG2_30_64_16]